MNELRPSTSDIFLTPAMIHEAYIWLADDTAFRALMLLVYSVSGGLAWTYTPPGDGSFPDDDKILARYAHVSPAKWRKIRPNIEQFFVSRGGRWHLNRDWISIQVGARCAIPKAIQREVLSREGRRCTYCGDIDGPFHFDHIFPVSKGGTNNASNITIACRSCNLSKSDKTLAEWFAEQREASA